MLMINSLNNLTNNFIIEYQNNILSYLSYNIFNNIINLIIYFTYLFYINFYIII
jgi:hypothetical protein